jgi:hypothetical protein
MTIGQRSTSENKGENKKITHRGQLKFSRTFSRSGRRAIQPQYKMGEMGATPVKSAIFELKSMAQRVI